MKIRRKNILPAINDADWRDINVTLNEDPRMVLRAIEYAYNLPRADHRFLGSAVYVTTSTRSSLLHSTQAGEETISYGQLLDRDGKTLEQGAANFLIPPIVLLTTILI
jgi:hypothetical protein